MEKPGQNIFRNIYSVNRQLLPKIAQNIITQLDRWIEGI